MGIKNALPSEYDSQVYYMQRDATVVYAISEDVNEENLMEFCVAVNDIISKLHPLENKSMQVSSLCNNFFIFFNVSMQSLPFE